MTNNFQISHPISSPGRTNTSSPKHASRQEYIHKRMQERGVLSFVAKQNISIRMLFLMMLATSMLVACSKADSPIDEPEITYINGITRVFEYLPAPGQFINTMPEATADDTPETMRQKTEEALKDGRMICLGGFGGYIVFGFDHTIINREGNDFVILGNAINIWAEPGVIMVSVDVNGNGLPDDEWYEIAGSEYHKTTTIKNYEITYYKPESEPSNPNEPNYIRWTDNQGQTGYLSKVGAHTQPYYPLWAGESYTLKGTFMEANVDDVSGNGANWVNAAYEWGYADNWGNNDVKAQIDIDWAVDKNGNPVKLKGIDFVRVHTGNRAEGGWLGEVSTEVSGFTDLNL